MYKIGEFSKLAKSTIKTLRYYEKEKLLIPCFVDESGYRYYNSQQLLDLAKIVSYRQMGFSIEEIRTILNGADLDEMLEKKREELAEMIESHKQMLSKVNYLMEEKKMKYEVFLKQLPECDCYYKEGVIPNYSDASEFILSSAQECLKDNPNIKCIEPDYCFMCYLDHEYKENNIHIRYYQATETSGKENETIKFTKLKEQKAICVYHMGHYDTLSEAYGFIMKYIEENGFEIAEAPRERYIDGIWNKENPKDWLTEIQVPVK